MITEKLLFTLFLSSILFAQSNFSKDYFPLKNGIQREYLSPGANGSFITYKEYITKKNNQYTITQNSVIAGINIESRNIYEIHKDGIYEIAAGGGMFNSKLEYYNNPYLYLKFPIKLKSKWNYIADNGLEITREIVAILDECDVKNGHTVTKYHDVIKIKHMQKAPSETEFHTKYEYYANRVGLIKEELEDGILFRYLAY